VLEVGHSCPVGRRDKHLAWVADERPVVGQLDGDEQVRLAGAWRRVQVAEAGDVGPGIWVDLEYL
jgi:hypothetical protein